MKVEDYLALLRKVHGKGVPVTELGYIPLSPMEFDVYLPPELLEKRAKMSLNSFLRGGHDMGGCECCDGFVPLCESFDPSEYPLTWQQLKDLV